MNCLCRICWEVVKVVVAIVLVVAALVALVIALELPDARRFKRYCEYPNKDALLAAEAQNVVSSTDCVLNGTNVTIISMGPLGFLPSGAAMLVYDADGKLIDWTRDEGDDGCFQRKWSKVWHTARREETRRFVETLPVADISFWDALTNACERTGCKFDVYSGTVEIHE